MEIQSLSDQDFKFGALQFAAIRLESLYLAKFSFLSQP